MEYNDHSAVMMDSNGRWLSTVVNKRVDGMTSAAVKRLTDEKVLRADIQLIPHCKNDSKTAELRQVILYDKQTNINSVIAGHRITFTDDASELSSHYVSYRLIMSKSY